MFSSSSLLSGRPAGATAIAPVASTSAAAIITTLTTAVSCQDCTVRTRIQQSSLLVPLAQPRCHRSPLTLLHPAQHSGRTKRRTSSNSTNPHIPHTPIPSGTAQGGTPQYVRRHEFAIHLFVAFQHTIQAETGKHPLPGILAQFLSQGSGRAELLQLGANLFRSLRLHK